MPELWLKMNLPREKDLISKYDQFDSVMVSAHVIETFPRFLSAYIKRRAKAFIIDPFTHVLAHESFPDIIEVEEKRWFSKLIGAYGLDYLYNTGRNSLNENDLIDSNGHPTDGLRQFTRAVIEYQLNRINIELASLVDYEPDLEGEANPRFLIAPYFLIQNRRWLQICAEMANEAIQLKGKNRLLIPIFINKATLVTPMQRKAVFSALDLPGVDGYIIWVSDFRETNELEGTLRQFRVWVTELSQVGKPVYNLYGGLFSLLLADSGLSGVSHGICYGEFKDPTSEGGGGQIRYYHPFIRNKIQIGTLDSFNTSLQVPTESRCNCDICRVYGSDSQLERMDLAQANEHFLIRRIDEVRQINNGMSDQILPNLHSAYQYVHPRDSSGDLGMFYGHLERWVRAIRGDG